MRASAPRPPHVVLSSTGAECRREGGVGHGSERRGRGLTVLLSLWFLLTLATLAAAPLAASAAVGIRRGRRKRRGLNVRRGWRLGAIRLGATLATLLFATATIADGL